MALGSEGIKKEEGIRVLWNSGMSEFGYWEMSVLGYLVIRVRGN